MGHSKSKMKAPELTPTLIWKPPLEKLELELRNAEFALEIQNVNLAMELPYSDIEECLCDPMVLTKYLSHQKYAQKKPIWTPLLSLEQLAYFPRSYLITCPLGEFPRLVSKLTNLININDDRLRGLRKESILDDSRIEIEVKWSREFTRFYDLLIHCEKWVQIEAPFRYTDLPFELRVMILKHAANDIVSLASRSFNISKLRTRWSGNSEYQGNVILLVSKIMKEEANDVFKEMKNMSYKIDFKNRNNVQANIGYPPYLKNILMRGVVKIQMPWITGGVDGNDIRLAQIIAQFPKLEELHLEIVWQRFRHKHYDKIDLSHWLCYTPGIKYLIQKCPPLKIVRISHSLTAERGAYAVKQCDRNHIVKCLQDFLTTHLVPTSDLHKEWPGKRATLFNSLLRNEVDISTPEAKDDVRRSLQVLGYEKKLIDTTVRETAYDCRRALEIMDRKVEEEKALLETQMTVHEEK